MTSSDRSTAPADRDPAEQERRRLERRARRHAALGEPIRLSIVDDLAVSDRSPAELARRSGLASNLLAHHLAVLDDAGLIERFASAGDRRRRYVRLRRHALDDLAIGLIRPPGRMLFVCRHNSARSQLAAAMWSSRTGHPAASAGTEPADRVHPGAVAAAGRIGLDLAGTVPTTLSRLPAEALDAQIVTVCDQAHEEIDPPDAAWHWSIPDPVTIGSPAAFDEAVRHLDHRITQLTVDDGHAHEQETT